MKIFTVYHGCSENLKMLGRTRSAKRARKIVYKHARENGYSPYYWRSWLDEQDREWIDYGSWSEFFVIEMKVI